MSVTEGGVTLAWATVGATSEAPRTPRATIRAVRRKALRLLRLRLRFLVVDDTCVMSGQEGHRKYGRSAQPPSALG